MSDLFDSSFSPLKIDFWLQPNHWTALAEGMSADEAEALRYEWELVCSGQRSLQGRPCLCGVEIGGKLYDGIEKWPQAVQGGRGGAHDSLGSIVGLRCDLEMAADHLSLSWRATEQIFAQMGRRDLWHVRYRYFRLGLRVRAHDSDPEPYDSVTGRSLGRQVALAVMAHSLGWKGTCRWPRPEQAAPSGRKVLQAVPLQLAA